MLLKMITTYLTNVKHEYVVTLFQMDSFKKASIIWDEIFLRTNQRSKCFMFLKEQLYAFDSVQSCNRVKADNSLADC